jgi:DNA modification methylase
MMELDPRYCDVIVNRWEKVTGQKAKRPQTHEDP